MSERERFEQLLADDPLDTATRLVYADWLESEAGDPGQAEWQRKFAELIRKKGDPTIRDIVDCAYDLGLEITFSLKDD